MSNSVFISAAMNSKFYQHKLNKVPITDWEKVPLTTKQDLRNVDTYDLMGTSLANIATYHETSGTTGKPTPSWYSFSDTAQQANIIIESELKLQPEDVVLNRFPFALAIPSFIFYWACQTVKCTHVAASKATPVTPHVRVVELLLRTRTTVLTLIPSEAEIIAEAAHQLNVSLPTPGLRALVVAGELMTPARKKYLEKLWGVPVYGFFGSTETGGLYMQCKNGHYHLANPTVKVEVLDDAGNVAPLGVKGECVISTTREGMPLLRYANQDLIEIKDATICGCGCNEPVLIHYGRKEDEFRLQNRTFGFYEVQEAVYSLSTVPMLWRFNIYSDRLEFEYQVVDHPENEIGQRLQEELQSALGVLIKAVPAELIPLENLRSKPAYAKFAHFIKH